MVVVFLGTDCYEPEVIQGQVETVGLLLGKTILKQELHLLLFRTEHWSVQCWGQPEDFLHFVNSAEHCTSCPVLGELQNGFGRTSPGTHFSAWGWPGPGREKLTLIHWLQYNHGAPGSWEPSLDLPPLRSLFNCHIHQAFHGQAAWFVYCSRWALTDQFSSKNVTFETFFVLLGCLAVALYLKH